LRKDEIKNEEVRHITEEITLHFSTLMDAYLPEGFIALVI